MRVLIVILLLGTSLSLTAQKYESIFNGKDFTGWVVPDENKWWTINKGVLKGSNDPDLKGNILWTEKEYVDFAIQAEFKFGDGKIDSGIFLRDISQQLQIGISSSLKRDMTCSPYIQGKGYPVEAEGVAELLKMKGWNKVKAEVVGDTYTFYLNGKKVVTYTSDTALDKGKIGVQVHPGNDMEIFFRKLKVAEL